jgi:hypothetical protein
MSKKKQIKRRSPGFIVAAWIASILSLGLVYVAAVAVRADFASFRSCSANDSGLMVTDCGKHSLNAGDLLLLVLFMACAALALSLFTASLRMVWRRSE